MYNNSLTKLQKLYSPKHMADILSGEDRHEASHSLSMNTFLKVPEGRVCNICINPQPHTNLGMSFSQTSIIPSEAFAFCPVSRHFYLTGNNIPFVTIAPDGAVVLSASSLWYFKKFAGNKSYRVGVQCLFLFISPAERLHMKSQVGDSP